jgi:hypothetical protein
MQELVKSELRVILEKDPQKIVDRLHIGTSMPILPVYHKYLLKDINEYNAVALFLEEDIDTSYFGKKTDKIIGMTLVYSDGSETLYFGFFRVLDHDPKKIEFLMNSLINYANQHGVHQIRGPINVPTTIFGWGFMVEGSNKDLFIGSPINSPIYQQIFLENGFDVLFQEDRYDMPALKMDPHKNKKLIEMGINKGDYQLDPFDTGDYPYELYNLDKKGMMDIKDEYVELFTTYMPPSALISPKSSYTYDSLVDFIFEFGAEWMMFFVREKTTKQMVAAGYIIPDPYSRNKKGEIDSISFHAWVVHPDHRRRYLAMLMYGLISLKGKDRKTPHYITKGSWPVGAENIANGEAAKKMGGKRSRSHLILQMEL